MHGFNNLNIHALEDNQAILLCLDIAKLLKLRKLSPTM